MGIENSGGLGFHAFDFQATTQSRTDIWKTTERIRQTTTSNHLPINGTPSFAYRAVLFNYFVQVPKYLIAEVFTGYAF